MADRKLSALTELATTPASDDEVYIRDVSELAADESKRITIANLIAYYVAHKTQHQDGGGDEISVTGLSGLLADDQHVLDAEVRSAAVSNAAYGAGWNGVTTIAPSKNAVYDKIETLGDAAVATGTYTGNGDASRQITTGFVCKTVFVMRQATSVARFWPVLNEEGADTLRIVDTDNVDDFPNPYLHATDGFVVATGTGANTNGDTFNYIAFGE